MKFLCVANQIDSYVFSKLIKERFPDVDAILAAGDIPLEYIDYLGAALEKPVFYIQGDHHFYSETGQAPKATPADFVSLKARIGQNTVLIAGASGSCRHNENPLQYSKSTKYTDKQMFFRLLALVPSLMLNKLKSGRYLDIFLTHVPPFGINDFNEPAFKSFACYRWFIERFKPKFLVHGHIHMYDSKDPRVTEYKNTSVVNACGHHVIEL
jgi:Icc-related predicted phosphoesterase